MPGRVPPRVPPRATIVKVVGCVVGVVGSLLVYGILQERIMATPYDDGGAEE
jgi:adenosine 3'-phospho 5'-phosphosulfate transporter B2